METVKSWAFSVCAASICGAVLNMILPEGSAQKTYKAVFCIFFLCVLIAPLSELKIPDFDSLAESVNETKTEDMTENEFSESYISAMEKAVIADTKAVLSENGITAKDISIKINISGDGGIDINKFTLTLDSAENPGAIGEKVYEKTGIMPEIIISEED